MTIASAATSVVHTGNSAAVDFPFDFVVPSADDLVVTLVDKTTGVQTTLLPSEFVATGFGTTAGNVNYSDAGSPISSNYELIISREVPATQLVSVSNQKRYFPAVVEGVWDKLTMLIQQLQSTSARTLRAPVGDTLGELPIAEFRTGKYLTFDINGDLSLVTGTLDPSLLRTARAPDGEALAELPAAASRINKFLAFDESGDLSVVPFPQSDGSIVRADKGWAVFDFPQKNLDSWTDGLTDHWLTGISGSWDQPAVTNQSSNQSFPEITEFGPVFRTDAYTYGHTGPVIFHNAEDKKLFLARIRYRLATDNSIIAHHRVRIDVVGYDETFTEIGITNLLDVSGKQVSDGWQVVNMPFFSDHQSGAVFHRLRIRLGSSSVVSTEFYDVHEVRVKIIDTMNALDWGAKAEGTGASAFDNSDVIEPMIAYIKANQAAPSTIVWPSNGESYKFTRPIVFEDMEKFGFVGDARWPTQLYFTEDCTDDYFHIKSSASLTNIMDEIFLANFTILGSDHTRTDSSLNSALRLDETIQCSILNVGMRQAGRGLEMNENATTQSPDQNGSSRTTISNCIVNQNFFPNGNNGAPLAGIHFRNSLGTDKGQNCHISDTTIYSKLAGINDQDFDGTGSAATWYEMDISAGLAIAAGIWVYEFVDGEWVEQDHVSGDYVLQVGLDIVTSSEVNTATDRIELPDHGAADNDQVFFSAQAGGTLPSPLVAGTTYHVVNATDDDFQVSLSSGGAAVNITTTGTGTCNVWQVCASGLKARSNDMPWANGENIERIRVQSTTGFASGTGNVDILKRDPFGSVGLFFERGSANSAISMSIGGYEEQVQLGTGAIEADQNYCHLVYAQIGFRVFRLRDGGGTKQLESSFLCDEYAEGQIKQFALIDGGITRVQLDRNALPPVATEEITSNVTISGLTVVVTHSIKNWRPGTLRMVIMNAQYEIANSGAGSINADFTMQYRVSGNATWTTIKQSSVQIATTGTSLTHEGEIVMVKNHMLPVTNPNNVTKTLQYRLLAEDLVATSMTVKGSGNADSAAHIFVLNP